MRTFTTLLVSLGLAVAAAASEPEAPKWRVLEPDREYVMMNGKLYTPHRELLNVWMIDKPVPGTQVWRLQGTNIKRVIKLM